MLRPAFRSPRLVFNLTRSITLNRSINLSKAIMSSTSIPKTQRAIFQSDPLSTHLTLLPSHPVPTPNFSRNEHLIRVHATAITNGELLWTKNFPPPPSPSPSPNHSPNEDANPKILIPCNDVAGTVILAPPSSPFPPGTEVYARSSYTRTGCARPYTILLTEEMARRPASLSWAESAATPMSVETAWQALFVHAGLSVPGVAGGESSTKDSPLTIYVTAAAGGVGVWVVQLAKWAGARVIASCSSSGADVVRKLGADEVVDYKSVDIQEWVATRLDTRTSHPSTTNPDPSTNADPPTHPPPAHPPADIVIDCIGRASLSSAWHVVKPGGKIISIFEPPEDRRPPEVKGKEVESLFFIMKSDGEQLEKATKELIERGGGRPAVDSVWTFEEFEGAFERSGSGRTRGKVVVDLSGEGGE